MTSPHARWMCAAAALLLAGCYSVPGTGRSQFRITSLDQEMSLGEQGYAEELKDAKLVTSGPEYEMVQRVGKRIADSASELYPEPAAEFEWEVKLIDDPKMVNAWCMPGGKMAVYTGLLPVTQNEEALAVVVGHEVGHAVARHGGERMSEGLLVSAGLGVASVSMQDMKPEEQQALLAALVGLGTYGVMYPFSRTQEAEADDLGLHIAAWAGYDPHAAIPLWERMAKMGGSKPPEILSTHPSDESRIEHMKDLMPEAVQLYEEGLKKHGQTAIP